MVFFWAKMADAAYPRHKAEKGVTPFYLSKIQTAEFYFERLLPKAESHKTLMLKGAKGLMNMDESQF